VELVSLRTAPWGELDRQLGVPPGDRQPVPGGQARQPSLHQQVPASVEAEFLKVDTGWH
jgi:hypothetical protein